MKKTYISLDRSTKQTCNVFYPENITDLKKIRKGNNYIVQGSGISYTAASFDSNSIVIKMDNFNRIKKMDQKNNQIVVESGVKLFELYNYLIVKGFTITSIPGYYNITIGGIIAANTHGKDHYMNGCFYNSVESLEIFHPIHGQLICSRDSNRHIFDLTIGGFGLTGVIINVVLRIKSISKNRTKTLSIYHSEMKQVISSMYNLKDKTESLISWHNLSSSSKKFGEGIVMYSKLSQGEEDLPIDKINIMNHNKSIHNINFFNRLTIPWINKLFLLNSIYNPYNKVTPHFQIIFPWHNKLFYFFGYGERGFIESQVLIPKKNIKLYFDEFQYLWKKYYTPILITSCKIFRGRKKYLNFDGDGLNFSIDIIKDKTGLRFLNHLDKINIKYGCISNIMKDSRLQYETIIKQYKDSYLEFKKNILEYDQNLIFRSHLTNRIGMLK